jgi:ORF6N domain-containing protein
MENAPDMSESLVVIPLKRIEGIILVIRGEKVILDSDLAALYGVTTKRLNESKTESQSLSRRFHVSTNRG